VYYDPADPAAGVLLPSLPRESPQRLVAAPLAVLSGLFIAAWGAALPLGVRRVRKFLERPFDPPCRIPSLGALRPTPDGWEIHTRRSPIAVAWLAYAAVAGLIIAAATWRQQRTGETMSMAAVIYGTVSCLCAAVACGLLAARRTKLRLVLDTQNRLLLAGADHRQFSLPFDELAAWTVTWADGPSNATAGEHSTAATAGGGTKPRRDGVPVLGIRTRGDQVAKIHLFTGPALWADRLAAARKTAEELAKITACDVEAV
jgi:hypothetical protein